jgi:hypothetical protein
MSSSVEFSAFDATTLAGQPAPPRAEATDAAEDRYVAASGSSWTIAELTALARDCLVDEPED